MTMSLFAAKSVTPGITPVIRLMGYIALAAALCACAPPPTESELLDRARLAIDEGKARAAIIDVKAVLQQNQENAFARRLLGEVYVFQQDPVTAAEEFERALAAAEDDEVLILYAQTLLTAGRREHLLALHNQDRFSSVSENPRYLAALARGQATDGDVLAATQSMRAAMDAAPDDPYVATTNAFFQLMYSGAMEDARDTLQDVLVLHPQYVDAWSLLGSIQQMNDEFELAETSFANVAEINSYRLPDRLNLVSVRIEQGKTEAAETELNRLLTSFPDHHGVHFLHGRMLLESGDNERALAALFKVLNVEPKHSGSLYLAAIANTREGNFATALDQLNRFLNVQPNHLNGRLLLSSLHLLMASPAEAESLARDILEEDYLNYSAMGILATALNAPGLSESQGTGSQDSKERIELYQRMASARPEVVTPRLAMASLMLQESRGAEAVNLLVEVKDDFPDSPGLWLLLTEAHMSVGNLVSAAETGEYLLGLLPDDAIALSTIGRLEIRREQYDVAEKHLRQALAVAPDNSDFHKLLVDALMGQGKLEEANTVLDGLPEAIAREPMVLVAKGRIALAQSRPEQAESYLSSALEETPSTMTLMWLHSAIAAQGRENEAIKLLNDWLVEYPTDVLVRNQLASIYLQSGQEQEAREEYLKVLEKVPDNVLILNNLAWLLRGDDPQQALIYIEKAYELAPNNPRIMDTYAMIQFSLNTRSEALSLNQKALELMPDSPQIQYHRALILHADGQEEQAIRILETLVGTPDVTQQEQARILLAEIQD